MTSKTVAALLSDLEVTRSHSRARVSNDNPYSEAIFKTLKYGPEFPERFASVHAAGVAKERSATLTAARTKHPERFTTTTDPKILALPGPAWINQPKETTEQSAA